MKNRLGLKYIMRKAWVSLPFFMAVIVLIGCYSVNDYNFSAVKVVNQKVNVDDGVDSIEAVFIAQKFLYEKTLYHRLYSLTPYRIRLKKEPDAEGRYIYLADPKKGTVDFQGKKRWEIQFRDKEESLLWGLYPIVPFYVDVDAQDGKVAGYGLLRK